MKMSEIEQLKVSFLTYWMRSRGANGGWDHHSNGGDNYDRWRVINPKNSASGRWELWDCSGESITWRGDWHSLKEAKQRAWQLEKSEARNAR